MNYSLCECNYRFYVGKVDTIRNLTPVPELRDMYSVSSQCRHAVRGDAYKTIGNLTSNDADGNENVRRNFISLSYLDTVPRNSTPGGFAYI